MNRVERLWNRTLHFINICIEFLVKTYESNLLSGGMFSGLNTIKHAVSARVQPLALRRVIPNHRAGVASAQLGMAQKLLLKNG